MLTEIESLEWFNKKMEIADIIVLYINQEIGKCINVPVLSILKLFSDLVSTNDLCKFFGIFSSMAGKKKTINWIKSVFMVCYVMQMY